MTAHGALCQCLAAFRGRLAMLVVPTAAMFGSACSAREACNEDYIGETLTGAPFSRSTTLDGAGAGSSARFRATLTGLPELWQSTSALVWSSMQLRLHQSYADREADGRVEMPRVSVAMMAASGPASSEPLETSLYPPADGSVFTASVFGTCSFDSSTNCCEYGASECSTEWTVALERIDGEPYPPMELTWELEVSVAVSNCPLEGTLPELGFEEIPL
jgi:hypothetical protein